jgi:hypothetical protein
MPSRLKFRAKWQNERDVVFIRLKGNPRLSEVGGHTARADGRARV